LWLNALIFSSYGIERELLTFKFVYSCHDLLDLTSPLFVQLCGMTLQLHAPPEQRDMAKAVLLFLVEHSGTHSHCLFVIHH